MTNPKLRWGILSTANIARAAVIPAIQHSTNGEVLAVASRDAQKAHDFAARTGIGRSYGSYEALLAAPDIDAIYIALPNSLHCEWSIKAAEAGKHVLCEKPLALDAAECAQMEDAARRHGVVLMEAFMYGFHPQTVAVIALLREGALGELRLIHSAFTFRVGNPANIRLQPDLGGGALMDVGCYCVNVSRTLAAQQHSGLEPAASRETASSRPRGSAAGSEPAASRETASSRPRGSAAGGEPAARWAEPEEVQATANWTDSGVDGQMAGWLRFSGGLLATFDCALTVERREYYELAGSEGTLLVPVAFLPGSGDTVLRLRQKGKGERMLTIAGADEYRLMVEHFAACVLEGAALRYPPSEAAANMRALSALYRSARNGGRPEKPAGAVAGLA